jgi:nucleotide-binding universal stress UspA family protein
LKRARQRISQLNPESIMKPFSKILVPVDFSPHSREATLYAVDLARRYSAPITLVHAYQPIVYALPESYVVYTPNQLANILTELQKQLAAAKVDAELAGATKVDTSVLQGDVASQIVQCAVDGGHDLIVMGTHGRTGPAHLLLGSIAEKVVRRAPCPVLTVHAASSEKKA